MILKLYSRSLVQKGKFNEEFSIVSTTNDVGTQIFSLMKLKKEYFYAYMIKAAVVNPLFSRLVPGALPLLHPHLQKHTHAHIIHTHTHTLSFTWIEVLQRIRTNTHITPSFTGTASTRTISTFWKVLQALLIVVVHTQAVKIWLSFFMNIPFFLFFFLSHF